MKAPGSIPALLVYLVEKKFLVCCAINGFWSTVMDRTRGEESDHFSVPSSFVEGYGRRVSEHMDMGY